MADTPGGYIAGRDREDFALLMREFRAVGKTLRRIIPLPGRRPSAAELPVIGKPASAFSPGVLSDPDNVVNVWRLPRVSGDDPEATGGTTKATYCTGTFGTSDLVVVTPMADGSRVVSCWPGA